MYVYTYAHICVYTQCMHLYMCICVHICICVRTCITVHTYIQVIFHAYFIDLTPVVYHSIHFDLQLAFPFLFFVVVVKFFFFFWWCWVPQPGIKLTSPVVEAQSLNYWCVLSCSVMSDSCSPIDCSPPAPLSMGSSRQEYWSGLPFPSPGNLPNPGIEPGSPALQAYCLPTELRGKPS